MLDRPRDEVAVVDGGKNPCASMSPGERSGWLGFRLGTWPGRGIEGLGRFWPNTEGNDQEPVIWLCE